MAKINPKKGVIGGVFDDLFELGKSTAKDAVKQVGQTFSPLKILENLQANDLSPNQETKDQQKKPENPNTPLDLKKLQENYQKQDEQKLNTLRKRLFQRVKKDDENLFEQQRNQEQQQKAQEEKEKQIQEQQRLKAQQQPVEIPQGKIRRSIFSPKRIVKRDMIETKASKGHQ